MKKFLTDKEVRERAMLTASRVNDLDNNLYCYAIPRGGVSAAYLVQNYRTFHLTDSPDKADFFLDDLVDSGRTRVQYAEQYPNKPFLVLFDKQLEGLTDWLVFPWENTVEGSAEDIVTRQLEFIGEDITREGLKETPRRVIKAYETWFSGYEQDPKEILKTFEDGSANYDEMVIVKDIPFYSHCEHHLAPFFGTATVAYIPNKKIVGLSKLSRIVNIFARRLQVQERLTTEVAAALTEALSPIGVGVIVKARHLCMESRGIAQQGHTTITSALTGAMKEKEETRAEFMRLEK